MREDCSIIGPGWERGSLISIDCSIQWYILGYAFISLGRLMATAYRELTVYSLGPASVILSFSPGRHMQVHSSKSQRDCVQVVWPHRVTGLLTGNLKAHALATCALPCHGHSTGKVHVYAYTRTVWSDVTSAPAVAPGVLCYIHNYNYICGPTWCKISCLVLRRSAIIFSFLIHKASKWLLKWRLISAMVQCQPPKPLPVREDIHQLHKRQSRTRLTMKPSYPDRQLRILSSQSEKYSYTDMESDNYV